MTSVVGLPAELRGALALSDTSTAAVRPRFDLTGETTGTAIDLSTAPFATLTFGWHRSEISLGYGPLFTLRDTFSDGPAGLIFHTAYASYAYQGRRYRLMLSETATLGQLDYSSLALSTPINPQTPPDPTISRVDFRPPPNDQIVYVVSEQTSASLSYLLSRRWTAAGTVSFGITGGLGENAEVTVPRQVRESVALTLDHALSRIDHLGGGVFVSHADVSNTLPVEDPNSLDANHWVVVESGTWTHNFNRQLRGQLSLGLSETFSRERHGTISTSTNDVFPAASAALAGGLFLVRHRHLSVSLLLGSSLAPAVNPLTGSLQQRLQGSGTLLVVADRATVSATLDGGQTIPFDDDQQARVIGFGLGATYHVSRLTDLAAGYRTVWQLSSDPRLDRPPQWIAFVSLIVRAPPLLF